MRSVDYSLEPLSGVVLFSRPLPLFDDSLNIVQVVATYEYQTSGLHNSVYVARGQQAFEGLGLSVRGMAGQTTVPGGTDLFLGGFEADQRLPRSGRLHVELPVSHGASADGSSTVRTGVAIRAEIDQPLNFAGATLRGRLSRTDNLFWNPYGSPAVPGSTVGSGGIELHPNSPTRIRLTATDETTRSSLADATRTTVTGEWSEQLGKRLTMTGIFDARHLDDKRAARTVDSQMLTGIVDWQASSRLITSLRREQNLGSADPTYPDQTVLSGRYQVAPGTRVFATQRWSDAPIVPITGVGSGGVFTPLSTRETAVGIESRVHRFTTLSTRYQVDQGLNGTDGLAVLGVLTRLPINALWSVDTGLDHAVHVEGAGQGYTSATAGLTFAPAAWRASAHYQYRNGVNQQHMLTTGIAGQLTPGLTALAHYRLADYAIGGVRQTHLDILTALAVRPRQTDRVGLLFSWNYGDDLSPVAVLNQETGRRVSRLSADGYVQVTPRVEFYTRAAALRTELGILGNAMTYLSQNRVQVRIRKHFDTAAEFRFIDEPQTSAKARVISAGEIGAWIHRDLRVALGYTTQPWTGPTATLATTTGRGGVYLVMSSRLSSLFDLFTPSAAR